MSCSSKPGHGSQRMQGLGALTLGVCLSALAAAPAVAAEDLSGETVQIVYNTGPGGAVGLSAQLIAANLGRFLPGEPEVIAVPMPGGALLRGIRYVHASEPDGLTLGWLAWGGATRVIDPPELQVPFHEMGILGGLATQWVTHVRTETAGGTVATPEDFMALGTIRAGGIAPNVSTDIRTAASLDILGLENDYVGGHTGGADVLAAMRRGEIDLRSGTVANYLTTIVPEMVETGETLPLYYWGQPVEDGEAENSALEGIPTFHAFATRQTGSAPSGPAYDLIRYLTRNADGLAWLFATPPGASDAVQDMYAEAFAQMMADPDFTAEMAQVLGAEPAVVLRDEAQAIVEAVRAVSPEIVETMQGYIERYSR